MSSQHSAELPKSWLMVRLSALGDVTLTTGVLAYLHTHHNWTFTVLTRPAFAPLFSGNPAVAAVEICEPSRMNFWQLIFFFQNLAQQHKGEGLLDLHANLRSRLLALFWKGTIRRYPKFSRERRLFLRQNNAQYSAILTALNVPQRYALATEAVAPTPDTLRPHIYLTAQEIESARTLLSPRSPDRPLIALHPYATHPAKAWKPAAWQGLAERLRQAGMHSFIIGSKISSGTGSSTLLSSFPAADWDFTNQTTLRETCALLSCADVLVSGDSGPMHLARGVDTPVLALFGPTTREWGFMPDSVQNRILELPLACRPCSLHGQGHCQKKYICMDISLEDVFRALCELLAQKNLAEAGKE